MNIRKSPLAGTSGQPSLEELALINQMSQRTLAAEEVYTFGVRLCDNQVDRDGERFPRETLEELALEELQAVSPLFGEDVYEALKLENCMALRRSFGGPAVEETTRQIEELAQFIKAVRADAQAENGV